MNSKCFKHIKRSPKRKLIRNLLGLVIERLLHSPTFHWACHSQLILERTKISFFSDCCIWYLLLIVATVSNQIESSQSRSSGDKDIQNLNFDIKYGKKFFFFIFTVNIVNIQCSETF